MECHQLLRWRWQGLVFTCVEIKKADSTFPYFPLEMRCFPFSTKKLAHDSTVTVVLVNNSYRGAIWEYSPVRSVFRPYPWCQMPRTSRDRENKRRNRQQHDRTSSLLSFWLIEVEWFDRRENKKKFKSAIELHIEESLSLLFLCWKLMEYASSSEMEKKGEEEDEREKTGEANRLRIILLEEYIIFMVPLCCCNMADLYIICVWKESERDPLAKLVMTASLFSLSCVSKKKIFLASTIERRIYRFLTIGPHREPR
jgi:hypothetical protein